MKHLKVNGLRFRLMLTFATVFFLLLVIMLSVTNVYFKSYYIKSNERHMKKAVHTYLESQQNGPSQTALQALQRDSGGQIVLYDQHLKMIPFSNEDMPLTKKVTGDNHISGNEGLSSNNTGLLQAELPMEKIEDLYEGAQSKSSGYFTYDDEMLYYSFALLDGHLLVIKKQMGILEEAEQMFDAFLMLISSVVFVIGILVTFFITKQMTKPILEMETVTAKMAKLDFREKLTEKGSHETRNLMKSINTMAVELSSNIENLKITNERLEGELSKEQRLEKMRRQFVSDVSHELKNPLSMIMAYADGLRQNIPKTETTKQEYYNIIMDESERMNKLVKDLLELSSYESGTFTIERERFFLNELIGEALERFEYIMNHKSITIESDFHEEVIIFADRLRVNQVIINLLSNAFKHVNEGGIIKINAEEKAEGVAITVKNTGELIPKEALGSIWNSFYQVKTESEGNGLGLAIVKSIVKLHGGHCRAYVEEGFNCFEVVI